MLVGGEEALSSSLVRQLAPLDSASLFSNHGDVGPALLNPLWPVREDLVDGALGTWPLGFVHSGLVVVDEDDSAGRDLIPDLLEGVPDGDVEVAVEERKGDLRGVLFVGNVA